MAYHCGPAGAASVALGFLLLICPVLCLEEETAFDGIGGIDNCLYESKEACTRADMMGCVWCDLPRRCYSAARSLELGEFCNRKKLEALVEVSTCDDILDQEHCHLAETCIWCTSEAVVDGCFSDIEAVRLPKQIFTCPEDIVASRTTTATGIQKNPDLSLSLFNIL